MSAPASALATTGKIGAVTAFTIALTMGERC